MPSSLIWLLKRLRWKNYILIGSICIVDWLGRSRRTWRCTAKRDRYATEISLPRLPLASFGKKARLAAH